MAPTCQLAKTEWLCGDKLTIADIAVAAPMHLHAAHSVYRSTNTHT